MLISESIIARHARDEIPETWNALANDASGFGEEALERRLNRVMRKVFGIELTAMEQELLDYSVIEYCSKVLVLDLIRPGIDFWTAQPITQSAGHEGSNTSYTDRAKELKEMRTQLVAEIGELYLDVERLLPFRPRRAKDGPKVTQIGTNVPHLTSSPFDLEPLYGLPEEDIAARDV